MASTLSSLKPNKRPVWRAIWPLTLVVVLAAGWSAYWFIASTKALEVLDQVVEREKAKGMDITCAKRNIEGYPFKFLLTCDGLKVARKMPGHLLSLTASRLVVVVQAYNFNHMIAELYGPFEISRNDKGTPSKKLFSGTAKTVTSSLILKNRVLQESTVIVRDLSGTLVDYSIQSAPQNITTSLKEAIAHIRSTGDTTKSTGTYEVAGLVKDFFLKGGSANFQSNNGIRLDDSNVRIKLSNAPYQLRGKPLDWLKIWKANEGEAKITELSATSGPVELKGSGTFTLDNLGRAQGVLNTKMTGLDSILKELVANGRIRQKDAELGLAAINLLGNAGAGSVKVALRAQKGFVYFGPFKIAVLKPLF